MKKSNSVKCDLDIKLLQDTLYVISGKWKLPIIAAIFNGASRYRDIQIMIPDITSRMLSKELKELEINKLILRKVTVDYPVIISYQLTAYSLSLKKLVTDMAAWGANHRAMLKRSS